MIRAEAIRRRENWAPLDQLVIATMALFILLPKFGIVDFTVFPIIAAFLALSNVKIDVNRENYIFLSIVLSMLSVIQIITFISNVDADINLPLKSMRIFLVCAMVYWIIGCVSTERRVEVVLYSILLAASVNSIVVLVQFCITLLGYEENFLRLYQFNHVAAYLRKPGLTSGFPPSGLLSAVGALVAIEFYMRQKKIKWAFSLLVCMPGVMLSARTSLFLFLFAAAILVLMNIFYRRSISIKGVVLFGLGLGASVLFLAFISSRFLELTLFMLEPVINLLSGEGFSSQSTDVLLKKHFFLPEGGLRDWLLGNGQGPWGNGGIPSDVWFTQTLVGSGVGVLFLYLVAFFFLGWLSVRRSGYGMLSLCLFGVVLISSFKGSYIFSRTVGDTVTLLGIAAATLPVGRSIFSERLTPAKSVAR